MPSDKRESHPHLAVKLYFLAAETEGFLGRHSQMETYCREVLVQKSISTLQKKDAHLAKLGRMANAEFQYDDACRLCLTVLKELGC
eukprot:1222986-Ditylum_brightwellii.AAC.1